MVNFVNVIDSYANGAAGAITLPDGENVGYSVETSVTNAAWTEYDFTPFDNSIVLTSNNSASYFTVNFDQEVTNLVMGVTAADQGDAFAIIVNGAEANLQDLADAGLITMNDTPDHTINANGQLEGAGGARSVTYIQFNFAVSSLGARGGTSTGGPSGVDFFEIGINETTVPVCFCTGTLIETDRGPQRVETLRKGARILTWDGAVSTLRYVVRTAVQPAELALNPALRPVCVAAGALGKGLPLGDLYVSQQHRLLVSSRIANRVCAVAEVLVAAARLSDLPGIDIVDDAQDVFYYHLVFDGHRIVYSNGAPTESLYLGVEALKTLPPKAYAEIAALFPDVMVGDRARPASAAHIPSGRRQRQLVARHKKNNKKPLADYAGSTAQTRPRACRGGG